jgi:hypothetical protein
LAVVLTAFLRAEVNKTPVATAVGSFGFSLMLSKSEHP